MSIPKYYALIPMMFQKYKIKRFLNKRLFFVLGFLENAQQNRKSGGLDCTCTFKYDYIRANYKVISSSYWELKFRIIANCLDELFL